MKHFPIRVPGPIGDTELKYFAEAVIPLISAAETNGSACGSCTECCTIEQVVELGKKSGERCKHCSAGGCAIYAKRPDECRVYYCGWRALGLAAELRPDASGVYPTFHRRPHSKHPFDVAIGHQCKVPGFHGLLICRPGSRGTRQYVEILHAWLGRWGVVKTESRSGKFRAVHVAVGERVIELDHRAAKGLARGDDPEAVLAKTMRVWQEGKP